MTAGIVLGSYCRRVGISPGSAHAFDTVWEFVAFLLTAVVFLLIGLTISLADLAAAAGPIAGGTHPKAEARHTELRSSSFV